jgi:hypothetical protein
LHVRFVLLLLLLLLLLVLLGAVHRRSVAIGAVYPAYATYKFLTRERYQGSTMQQHPPPHTTSSSSYSHFGTSPQHYPTSSSHTSDQGHAYGYPPTSSSCCSSCVAGGGGPGGERLLKYWAVAGGLYLGERLLEPFLAK